MRFPLVLMLNSRMAVILCYYAEGVRCASCVKLFVVSILPATER